LGQDVARTLFLAENPLGKLVRIGKVWFRVIGVLAHHDVSTAGAKEVNFNTHIFAPLNTVFVRFDRPNPDSQYGQLIIHVKDEQQILPTAKLIEEILMRRHDNQKNFSMIVPEQLLRQSEETQRLFNLIMGAIAGISLLVGGIGIMNIMLASVMERIREIGVRRAIGATRKDIIFQFLAEATFISITGGFLGILLGVVMARVISMSTDILTIVSFVSVAISFGVAATVGIVFGWLPARKAAEQDPVESLRHD
jgi:putative ABC transport system permease protein